MLRSEEPYPPPPRAQPPWGPSGAHPHPHTLPSPVRDVTAALRDDTLPHAPGTGFLEEGHLGIGIRPSG